MAKVPFKTEDYNELKDDSTIIDEGKKAFQIFQIDAGLEPEDNTIDAISEEEKNELEGTPPKIVCINAKTWFKMLLDAVLKNKSKVLEKIGVASIEVRNKQAAILSPCRKYVKNVQDFTGDATHTIVGSGAVGGDTEKPVSISIKSIEPVQTVKFDLSDISAGDFTTGISILQVLLEVGTVTFSAPFTLHNSLASMATALTNDTVFTWSVSGTDLVVDNPGSSDFVALLLKVGDPAVQPETIEKRAIVTVAPLINIIESVLPDDSGNFSKAVVIPNVSQFEKVAMTLDQVVATVTETGFDIELHNERHEFNIIP